MGFSVWKSACRFCGRLETDERKGMSGTLQEPRSFSKWSAALPGAWPAKSDGSLLGECGR
jgi:hypothetical protein